jgi:hypothetical protein
MIFGSKGRRKERNLWRFRDLWGSNRERKKKKKEGRGKRKNHTRARVP